MSTETHSLPMDDGTGSRQSMHKHLLWVINSLSLDVAYDIEIRIKGSAKKVRMNGGQSESALGNGQVLKIEPAPKSALNKLWSGLDEKPSLHSS